MVTNLRLDVIIFFYFASVTSLAREGKNNAPLPKTERCVTTKKGCVADYMIAGYMVTCIEPFQLAVVIW